MSRILRIVVVCEFSATVRDEFRKLGHDAWSLDVMPCERDPAFHIQQRLRRGDEETRRILSNNWDAMICHPPCTHTALSGARHLFRKKPDTIAAIDFCLFLLEAPIEHIALEQPRSLLSSLYRQPDQKIQPWQFGNGERKETWLWFKNLPPLVPTNVVTGRETRVHGLAPGITRKRERSRTFPGIAAAMASQWSEYLLSK